MQEQGRLVQLATQVGRIFGVQPHQVRMFNTTNTSGQSLEERSKAADEAAAKEKDAIEQHVLTRLCLI